MRNYLKSLFSFLSPFLSQLESILNFFIERRKTQTKYFERKWIFARDLKPDDLLIGRPYKQQYYPRTEDKLLKDLILQKKNVLVRGSPLAGKTRTVFEVLKSMDLSCDVIIPRYVKEIQVEDYPFPEDFEKLRYLKVALYAIYNQWVQNGSLSNFSPIKSGTNPKVVILDDLNKFVQITNFEQLFKIVRDKNFIIVATCQTGDPFNIVKSKLLDKRLDLETIFGENIIDISDITKDEAKQIAKNESIKWEDTEFDGTIGSVFLKLHEMSNRYDALKETEKDLLKTIKKLQISGIYEGNHIFPYEWIETAFSAKYPDVKLDWEQVLTSLKGSELASVTDEKKLHVEEVYLEKIVEFAGLLSELTILNEMLVVFSGKPDVLNMIGNRAASLALIRLETRNLSKIAITAYKEALKVYTLDEFPIQYAATQNNLGEAYRNLAKMEDKKNNLQKAITAYEKALEVYTFAEFPIRYATIQNNLGNAYIDLAAMEDSQNNLQKAITAYQEALRVRTFAEVTTYYAMTQNNLGEAYRNLARIEDGINNLQKAITAYEKTLEVYTFADFSMDYATTQNNLGEAYRNLAKMEDKKNNLQRAFKAYQEALRVRTFAEFPLDYAMTQNNLGNAYRDLAGMEDSIKNLQRAFKAYEKALEVYTFAEFPMDYAMTQNNLGIAYSDLAKLQDSNNNLQKAITAYKKALEVYTFAEFPMDYAMTQNNLGNAYRDLAGMEDSQNNLQKAITAYQEAQRVRTFAEFPMDYAMTQNNLGNAYSDLARMEDSIKNLQKAIIAYQEALRVRTFAEVTTYYAMTQNNLGNAYRDLAGMEDSQNNLQNAITAYEAAANMFEQENLHYYAEPLRKILPTLKALLNEKQS